MEKKKVMQLTMKKTLIFDIKRYAINDGPGIRMSVFFKGCPLACVWCHNPEGISVDPQKMYTRGKCIGCQECVNICPEQACVLSEEGIITDKNICVLCKKCEEVCPTKAIEMSGREITADKLLDLIEKEG